VETRARFAISRISMRRVTLVSADCGEENR
jgi:hypothetical protein